MTIEKLKPQDPFMVTVDRINELVEKANRDDDLLLSFKSINEPRLNDSYTHKNLNESVGVNIKTTGLYSIKGNNLSNPVTVLVYSEKVGSYFRTDIEDSAEKEILLTGGDKLVLNGDDLLSESSVDLYLKHTIIELFLKAKDEMSQMEKLQQENEKLKTKVEEISNTVNLIMMAIAEMNESTTGG